MTVAICQLPKPFCGRFEVPAHAQAQEGALLLVLLTGKQENNQINEWTGFHRMERESAAGFP